MKTLKAKQPEQLTTQRPIVYCRKYMPLLERSVIMLFSGGGVGKTFASLRVAIEFVIENPDKKVALWLTEDAEGETAQRFRATIACYDQPAEFFNSRIIFIVSEPLKLTKMQDGNAVLTEAFYDVRLDLLDYDLVVIDPLLQFNGGEENSNTHAGVLMGALKAWAAEEDKTILLLHHATWDVGPGRFKARGARELVNGCRGVYELRVIMTMGDKRGVLFETDEPDHNMRKHRKFILTKDNGLSIYFTDESTQLKERVLRVFPDSHSTQLQAPPAALPPAEKLIKMSIADHNDKTNPKGFNVVELPFYSIDKYVRDGKCYSPYLFKDGHRKGENNLGYSDIFCFDIDNGLTLEAGVKRFARYKSLIVTTKSHGTNGDRYRVFLEPKTPLNIPEYDHSDFMALLFDKIGNVDTSTKDLARFYFASPGNAKVIYSNSESLFDWRPIYKEMLANKLKTTLLKKKQQAASVRTSKVNRSATPRNTLPLDTIFISDRGSFTFKELRDSLQVGEKITVQCRKGRGHNKGAGPEYNKAAFVKKSDNGNVFYSCSGDCKEEGSFWCPEP